MAIHATIVGRLGRDAELRDTRKGGQMLRFNVACDEGWGENRTTTWVGCVVFGKRAETLQQILKKGTFVVVRGQLSTREADNGKTYVDMKADEVELGPRTTPAQSAPGESKPYATQQPADDLPF